jgi:hypothetical protein
MDKVWGKYKTEHLAIRKTTSVICSNMDEVEDVILGEISQAPKDKYCVLTQMLVP